MCLYPCDCCLLREPVPGGHCQTNPQGIAVLALQCPRPQVVGRVTCRTAVVCAACRASGRTGPRGSGPTYAGSSRQASAPSVGIVVAPTVAGSDVLVVAQAPMAAFAVPAAKNAVVGSSSFSMPNATVAVASGDGSGAGNEGDPACQTSPASESGSSSTSMDLSDSEYDYEAGRRAAPPQGNSSAGQGQN